eukprot:3211911-Rhodomonas_salina.1
MSLAPATVSESVRRQHVASACHSVTVKHATQSHSAHTQSVHVASACPSVTVSVTVSESQ